MTAPTPAPHPLPGKAPGPPIISAEQLQAWVERRRRFRRKVKVVSVTLLSVAVAALSIVWAVYHQQLLAAGHLNSIGFMVDWDLNFENFSTGGTTAVSFAPRGLVQEDMITARDLESLTSLSHLQSLDLSGLDRLNEDELAVVAKLGEVEDLQLNRFQAPQRGQVTTTPVPLPLTDRVLEHIKGLKRLKSLGLSGNRITDAGLPLLANLESLETLDLDGTPVTDAGLSALVGLKRLKMLRVENTGVTREGLARFQQKRPDVEVIHESSTMFPGVSDQ